MIRGKGDAGRLPECSWKRLEQLIMAITTWEKSLETPWRKVNLLSKYWYIYDTDSIRIWCGFPLEHRLQPYIWEMIFGVFLGRRAWSSSKLYLQFIERCPLMLLSAQSLLCWCFSCTFITTIVVTKVFVKCRDLKDYPSYHPICHTMPCRCWHCLMYHPMMQNSCGKLKKVI